MSLMPQSLGPGLGQPLSHLSCCTAGIWLVHFGPHPTPSNIHVLDLLESGLGKGKVRGLPLKDFWEVRVAHRWWSEVSYQLCCVPFFCGRSLLLSLQTISLGENAPC